MTGEGAFRDDRRALADMGGRCFGRERSYIRSRIDVDGASRGADPHLPVRKQPNGRLRADLAAAGRLIGGNDLWIAAHARGADLALVTNNVGEFECVDGLRIEDWTIDMA